MAITRTRMTEEEFMRLPEDGYKYELVDGEPKQVPTGMRHDTIAARVAMYLGLAARGLGFVTSSQAGFRMASRNIRCPDAGFTSKVRTPGGVPPTGFGDMAPDICVEVISPSEDSRDIDRKMREYFGAGAVFVWHLFPNTEEITVYTGPDDFVNLGSGDEITAGELLPAFRHKVWELFELD